MRHGESRLVAMLLVTGVLVGLGSSVEAAAPPTCQGRPATIVGTGPGSLGGTSGDDVIVTNGANATRAGGGDDLICITGSSSRPMYVHAGPGDDTVDSTSGATQAPVRLGRGEDTFVGGSGEDDVSLNNDDGEVDTVTTGAGLDRLTVGRRGAPVIDNIDAGPDLDLVTVLGIPGPGRVDGGDGDNIVSIYDSTGETWRIDRRTQLVTAGDASARWPGFVSFSLFGEWTSATFIGSRGADTFRAQSDGGGEVTARLGKGDDFVVLFGSGITGSVRGEGGRDTVITAGDDVWPDPARGTALLDLKHGRLTSAAGSDVALASFEDGVAVALRRATVIGTAGRNILHVEACRGVVRAGSGNDRIDFDSSFVACADERGDPSLRADGERGDDVLTGDEGDDVLIGGAGRDSATGGEGNDTCEAETRATCES